MDPIKVLIVEDNKDAQEILSFCVSNLSGFEIIGICDNGEELIHKVAAKKPDLVLTDIQLPNISGVEAIKKCIKINPSLKFIFVTAFDEYAVEAFDIAAVDYVVKPIEFSRLYKALEKAKQIIHIKKLTTPESKEIKKIILFSNGNTYYFSLTDIIFVEKQNKKCLIHTDQHIYEMHQSIKEINDYLDDSFFQTHRSFIINLRRVSYIKRDYNTFIAYFHNYDQPACISKQRIKEAQEKIKELYA